MIRKYSNIDRFKFLAFVIVLMVLPFIGMSCGDGGNGSGGVSGGTNGTGISSGTITGFGSVILNDSQFEVTSSTSIRVNDTSGLSQSDLKLGMVAVVKFDGANATSISVDDELKGRVDSVDPDNSMLTVMGTQITVDNATIFDNINPADLTGISAGDLVEVHGLFDFMNLSIRATRIEEITQLSPGEFEVKGPVSSFDNPPGSFTISTLVVDYAANNVLLPTGTGNGSFVEVKGDLVGGELVAVTVEVEDEFPDLNPNDEFEIEGIISFVDNPGSPSQIRINDQLILINSNTVFRDGDITNVAVGNKVEVEGQLNASGNFIAEKIKLKNSIRIEAQVAKSGSTLTVFQIITVNTTSFTDIEDDNGSTITADQINDGDYLEIRGFRGAGNSVIALEIKVDSDNRSILRGPVDAVANPNLTIVGVTIVTNASTEFEIDDVPVSAAIFFSSLNEGNIVKAREDSLVTTDTIIAKEVELKGDDD